MNAAGLETERSQLNANVASQSKQLSVFCLLCVPLADLDIRPASNLEVRLPPHRPQKDRQAFSDSPPYPRLVRKLKRRVVIYKRGGFRRRRYG